MKARRSLTVARSELWQLRGHKLLLNSDLLLSMAHRQLQAVLAQLFAQRDKKLDPEIAVSIEKTLETIKHAVAHAAELLKVLTTEKRNFLSWYESEYLDKDLGEAKRFTEYLKKLSKEK